VTTVADAAVDAHGIEELGATEMIEVREAPGQSNRLVSGLFLTSLGLAEAAWFAGLLYLCVRFILS
jgi:hypothetical protein